MGLGGMGLGGMGGAGNAAILSRLAGSGRMSGLNGFNSLGSFRPVAPSQKYSVVSDPQGGSSAGYLTLWNSPRLDTRLAFKVTGKRAAVGFSGNSYFHPFAWDGIHLFELDYDDQGRVLHAWELDNPGAPRLDFAWDGQRLLRVTGHDSSPASAVVYSRTLNYSGDRLTGEIITSQGGSSHIEYKYDKQGRLIEASADADRSIDGRSRKVYFLDEDKGKR
jgi:YD repeat-containing protein